MSTEQLKNSRTRREARKAARDKIAVEADQQEQTLSERLAEDKEGAAKKAASVKAPVQNKSKRERRADANAAAGVQADEQEAAIVGKEVETAPYLGEGLRRGSTPPLHVLNELSRKQTQVVRNDARLIANAAGRAAYDVARGKREAKKGPSRFQKMMNAQDAKSKAGKKDGDQ
jgi:hypothetical protein